jgi:hypothetical protein
MSFSAGSRTLRVPEMSLASHPSLGRNAAAGAVLSLLNKARWSLASLGIRPNTSFGDYSRLSCGAGIRSSVTAAIATMEPSSFWLSAQRHHGRFARCPAASSLARFVGGNLDDNRLLELAHRIELGTTSVVDVPTVGVQRHRNANTGRKQMPRLRYIEETTDKITASTRSRRTCCRARSAPTEADCVAGHVGLELRNVEANYPFERSRGFPGSEPNSGPGDHSRLSCSAGDTQLGTEFCGIVSKRSARTLAIMRRRREGTNWPRSLSFRR